MLFGVLSHANISYSLCFDGLNYQQKHQILRIDPYTDIDALHQQIEDVDALIILRNLFSHYPPVWRHAAASGVPLYYLSDDNFVVLRDQAPDYERYTPQRTRNTLRLFDGILASSEPLCHWYQEGKYHKNISLFGAIRDSRRDPAILSSRDGHSINIGCFGGDFRLSSLKKVILPALAQVATRRQVRFFARKPVEEFRGYFEAENIELITSDVTDDVGTFFDKWLSYELDIIIHPSGSTLNLTFKTANALLISYYLGAVPIVTAEPAYEGAGESEGVIVADGQVKTYVNAIENLSSRRYRHDMFARLETFVKRKFDAESNTRVLDELDEQLAR